MPLWYPQDRVSTHPLYVLRIPHVFSFLSTYYNRSLYLDSNVCKDRQRLFYTSFYTDARKMTIVSCKCDTMIPPGLLRGNGKLLHTLCIKWVMSSSSLVRNGGRWQLALLNNPS